VLMISSELPEVLRLADRIIVIREGRLVRELSHDEATEEAVVGAAAGVVAGQAR
jgi:ABC-type sugar transport system ATPase subunit